MKDSHLLNVLNLCNRNSARLPALRNLLFPFAFIEVRVKDKNEYRD